MSELNAFLGKRIRELRLQRHMSQEELAFAAGLNPTHLSEIERGIQNPTVDTISGLASALNISIVTLFDSSIVQLDDENIRLKKILRYAKTMSDDEQEFLLQMVIAFSKHVKKSKNSLNN